MKRLFPSPLATIALATLAATAALAACKNAADDGVIEILTVDDPFVGPPAATTLDVDGINQDGGVTSIVKGQSVSQANIDLGTFDETATYAIRVTAFGADGGALALGETLPVELGALAEAALGVFVQRKGEMARLPGTFNDARNAPLVGVLGGRYVLEAGGTDTATSLTSNLYDLLSYASFDSPPTFTSAPLSMALSDLDVLTIDANGGTWLDLTTDTPTAATLPTTGAGTWADVAGGQSFLGDDGTVYVVGATRTTGTATAAILVVSPTQTLSWASLQTPRAGAGAAWITGRGLVVAGGSGSGAGVEILGAAATQATPLGYPADSTTGGGLDILDSSHAVLVAGTTARVIDFTCGASCTAEAAWPATLSTSLTFAQVFNIDTASEFVVGEAADGTTHAFRVSSSAATEVPLKLARSHARAVRLPLGPVAIVGGNLQMESFIP